MSDEFDLVVIGAGSGGVAAARRAAAYGARVLIVEADRVGGTCVIRGCVPKKLMMYAAGFAQAFDESRGYGWTGVAGHVRDEPLGRCQGRRDPAPGGHLPQAAGRFRR